MIPEVMIKRIRGKRIERWIAVPHCPLYIRDTLQMTRSRERNNDELNLSEKATRDREIEFLYSELISFNGELSHREN